MRATTLGIICAAALSGTARAQESPVVVELFTSQGCSSCPPADAFLTDLAHTRTDILPLAFHVTYWDYLGWKDPYSLDAATARQRDYAKQIGNDGIYTPQMVVDGKTGFVGSDRSQGLAAIGNATHKPVAISLSRDGETLRVTVGAGSGQARVLLVGFDRTKQTPIGRGENSGRTLTESNIVRSFTSIGTWTGTTLSLYQPPPVGDSAAVLLQASDGRIIGAARLAS